MNKLKDVDIHLSGDITGEFKNKLINLILTKKDKECNINTVNNIVENLEYGRDFIPIHFYIVTPLNTDVTFFAQIMHSCYANPLGTMILVRKTHNGVSYTPSQFKKIGDMMSNLQKIGGVAALNDFSYLIDVITNLDLVKVEEAKLSKVAVEIKTIIQEIEHKNPAMLLPNKSPIQNIKRIVFSHLLLTANASS